MKETFIKQYQEDIKDNNYWVSRLQRSDEIGTNSSDILTLESRVRALTAKEVQDAAKKYFNMNNYFQAVLNPEHFEQLKDMKK